MEFVDALKQVIPYVGIGGIGLIVFYYLFREFIRRKIFPQLPPIHAYRLLRLFLILVFMIAALAIVVGVIAVRFEHAEKERQAESQRKVDEERREAATRENWRIEQQNQLEAARKERERLEVQIQNARAEDARRTAEKTAKEKERLDQEAGDAKRTVAEMVAKRQEGLEIERMKLEQERLVQRKRDEEIERRRKISDDKKDEIDREREERIRKASWCCQPDGRTRVCRTGTQFNMEVGDLCACTDMWGSGVACR